LQAMQFLLYIPIISLFTSSCGLISVTSAKDDAVVTDVANTPHPDYCLSLNKICKGVIKKRCERGCKACCNKGQTCDWAGRCKSKTDPETTTTEVATTTTPHPDYCLKLDMICTGVIKKRCLRGCKACCNKGQTCDWAGRCKSKTDPETTTTKPTTTLHPETVSPQTDCNTKTDCQSGEWCMNGICVSDKPEGVCQEHSECSGGKKCISYFCQVVFYPTGGCKNDTECPKTTPICYEAECYKTREPCHTNTDCYARAPICFNGQCTSTVVPVCKEDSDCPFKMNKCMGGKCKTEDIMCDRHNDCPKEKPFCFNDECVYDVYEWCVDDQECRHKDVSPQSFGKCTEKNWCNVTMGASQEIEPPWNKKCKIDKDCNKDNCHMKCMSGQCYVPEKLHILCRDSQDCPKKDKYTCSKHGTCVLHKCNKMDKSNKDKRETCSNDEHCISDEEFWSCAKISGDKVTKQKKCNYGTKTGRECDSNYCRFKERRILCKSNEDCPGHECKYPSTGLQMKICDQLGNLKTMTSK
jgi:hypothetical protein